MSKAILHPIALGNSMQSPSLLSRQVFLWAMLLCLLASSVCCMQAVLFGNGHVCKSEGFRR